MPCDQRFLHRRMILLLFGRPVLVRHYTMIFTADLLVMASL